MFEIAKIGIGAQNDIVNNEYKQALTAELKSRPSFEERSRVELENEIILKTFLASLKAPDLDQWQTWGFGQMRNKRTGKIVKVPTNPGTGGDGQFGGSNERQWIKLALQQVDKQLADEGVGEIVQLPDGNTIFKILQPEIAKARRKTLLQDVIGDLATVGRVSMDMASIYGVDFNNVNSSPNNSISGPKVNPATSQVTPAPTNGRQQQSTQLNFGSQNQTPTRKVKKNAFE